MEEEVRWVKRANEHVHETIAHPCRTLLAFDLASSPATGGLLMESSGETQSAVAWWMKIER